MPLSRRDVLRRSFFGTVVLALGGLLGAACPPAIPKPSEQQPGQPLKGGHIVEAQTTEGKSLLQFLDSSNVLIPTTLFEGLLTLAPDGGLVPQLADALPKVSADGLTYTFALRKDVKWTDGMPLTADDVVFTYKLMYHPDYKVVPSPRRSELEAALADIKATDPYTVVMTTTAPNASFLANQTRDLVVPQHILGNVPADAITSHPFNAAPTVSCGPFKFQEWKNGDHQTVVRNETYYRGAPHLDSYVVKLGPDINSILSQLKTGEVDAYRGYPFSRYDELRASPNIQLDVVPTGQGPRVWFNLDPSAPTNYIFNSKVVRQALWHAADLQGITNSVLFKFGSLPSSTGLFPPFSWANNPDAKPALSYESAGAQQQLDAEGWKRGASGIREKDGRPMKFEILTSGDNNEWQQVANILQQNWKDIGADVSIRAPRFAQQVQSALDRDFDVLLQSNPYSGNSDPDPTSGFHSRGAVKSGRNYSNYKNPQVDQLIDQALVTLDQATRKDLYFRLQDIVNEEVPSFATAFWQVGWFRNKRIGNLGTAQIGPYTTTSRWALYDAYVTDGK